MTLSSINPATGETIETYEETSPEEAQEIISGAWKLFGAWRKIPFRDRADLMKNAGKVLRENRDAYAGLMAREMGKPVNDGRAEADKCAWACDYFAENAEAMLKPEEIETGAAKSYVIFQPLGVILAIMPWNYPFWQVFRFAAPSLMAGNAAVLKHASNVSGCALAIEDVFRKAGFPEGLFRSLILSSKNIENIIENPMIRGVAVTGSRKAGRSVASKAGNMLKKTVLELGGSDPYVILQDADLKESAKACADSRLLNSGQSCIAAKRFIAIESVREDFERLLVDEMKSRKMGDPLDEEVQIGPQARKDLRESLHVQVRKSIEKGAKCLLGGEMPDGPGAYYPLTVLTNVRPGMPAFDEETFGPVASIISAADEDEAVSLANQSEFGLGAALFSKNVQRAEQLAAAEIEAGNCFINDFVKSDPRLPFGGVKDSGYGRELSAYGIKEFVNVKTIYIK